MILDDFAVANYQVVANKLTSEILPFYKNLRSNYSDTKKGFGKVLLGEEQKIISKVLPLLQKTFSDKGIKKAELQLLDKYLKELVVSQAKIAKIALQSSEAREGAKKAAKDVGVSQKDLRFSKQFARTKQPKNVGSIRNTSDMLSHVTRALGLGGLRTAAGLGAVSQVAGPMLGPLAGPLGVGYEALRGAKGLVGLGAQGIGRIGKGLSSIKQHGLGGAFKRGLSESSTVGFFKDNFKRGRGDTLEEPSAGLVTESDFPEKTRSGVQSEISSDIVQPRDSKGRFLPFSKGKTSGSSSGTVEELFRFFNKRALKATWTKRVLRALETGGKGGKTSGSGGIGGFLAGGIGGLLGKGVKGGVSLLGKGATALGAVGLGTAATVAGIGVATAAAAYFTYKDVKISMDIAKALNEQAEAKARNLKIDKKLSETVVVKRKAIAEQAKSSGMDIKDIKQKLASGEITPKDLTPEQRKIYRSSIVQDKISASNALSTYESENKGMFGGFSKKEQTEIDRQRTAIRGMDKEISSIEAIPDASSNAVTQSMKEQTEISKKMLEELQKKPDESAGMPPTDTFGPPFDQADPLLNQLNHLGSLNL